MRNFTKIFTIIVISLTLKGCNVEFLLTGKNSITVINKTNDTVKVYWYELTLDSNNRRTQIQHELGKVQSMATQKFIFKDWDCDHLFEAIGSSGQKWRKELASCSGATWTLEP